MTVFCYIIVGQCVVSSELRLQPEARLTPVISPGTFPGKEVYKLHLVRMRRMQIIQGLY